MPPENRSIPISPARRAAYDILSRVEEGAYASILLASIPDRDLSHEDRGLAQEIVLGVLRWQKSLDYFIERYSRRPRAALDLPVLIALRMGLYQLRRLSRVPASAAVNESVNLVKRARISSAASMVNAVLRNADRRLEDVAGEGVEDPMERVAIEVSHPKWLLERWIRFLGMTQTRALALANNEPPRIAFRINTLRASIDDTLQLLTSEGAKFRHSDLVPGALVAEHGGSLAGIASTRSGRIYIQSEASQLISLLLGAEPGQSILDLCASPGSKATHIAALTSNKSWVVACDIHQQRLRILSASCEKLGVTSVDPLALNAALDLPFIDQFERFDRVLIDASCTGTGTLRENPEIKWRLTPADIARLADLQFSLLSVGAKAVKPGGRLVYSTCSIEPEENEEVVKRFLATGAPFKIAAAEIPLPDRARYSPKRPGTAETDQSTTETDQNAFSAEASPEIERDSCQPASLAKGLVTPEGFVRTFPNVHGTDGFFAAILERR